ncbi:hypothetical protein EN742_33425 [Mesorhizobium sp. M4A.F.Ca.ET.020.02.1.1]|uniref:hypothetical protein n=1 Tax=Mesorhizobium sp. M4A.F.Ca.ET.020.02.1.1 TaxID=2496652 RepID=UPI000FD3402A|nr:hypothetical protein [Mesorhizobium sp. M4A.F.Ca.ET.020.02.1.1]RVD32016.1 hypothetical protein EN742_33425 [Mesorhizobium sp. M4A.F.Ca.ET.020.02.1.1]
MSETVLDRLEKAKAEVARLEIEARAAHCSVVGHRWKSIGGCNAGCHKDCSCSVPVHECEVCKECDYGDNAWADETRRNCVAVNGPFEDEEATA